MERLGITKELLSPVNWAIYPTLRKLWPWFVGLAALILVAVPWGIRNQERNLEQATRVALAEAGLPVQNIVFTGRSGTVYADFGAADKVKAASALSGVNGIRGVDFQPTSGSPVVAPPVTTTTTTTTTLAPTTTTEAPGEPASITLTVNAGRMVLDGALPDARTVAAISRLAVDLYGPSVVNELLADSTLASPLWLHEAEAAAAVLPMITDGQLTLDRAGAHLTGTVYTKHDQQSVGAALQRALGADIRVDLELAVKKQEMPSVEIVANGVGDVVVRGTVADKDIKRSILQAVEAIAGNGDITNELVVGKNTADVYIVRRLPSLLADLSGAAQWALRYDGAELTGAAVGGNTFNPRAVPTIRMRQLLSDLGALVAGNATYSVDLEIHSTAADGNDANRVLSRNRLTEALVHLVHTGTDPDRVSTGLADGEGELLRFRVGPVDGE